MKIRILIAFLLITWVDLCAQVGVGTTNPHSSAALDVDVSALPTNAKKGFLLPRVSLQSNIDETTIPSPANNLLAYTKANEGVTPNEIYANFIYSWRGSHWEKFSNLPEVKELKIPIDFAIAGKDKQIFSTSQISALNSSTEVNTVALLWNTANDVVIANPTDVLLSNATEIKILTSSLYQISGTVSFKPDAAGATNLVVTLQRSSDNGSSWTDVIGAAMPFENSIAAYNETVVFPDFIKRFEANDLIRFVVSRPKNPWTSGTAPTNYGTNSGIQSRLDEDVNKSFKFTRLQE